jgi:GntR family transcriptional regulator
MARTTLDHRSRMPLYAQLSDDLRRRIFRGEFDDDERIPSKAAIAADYHVSPRTVDTAIQVLKGEGILVSTPGKRMFIVPPEERGAMPFRRRATDK